MNSPWFTTFSLSKPDAPVRLLCLPSSGGGASLYRPWLNGLQNVELHAAMLPGRERRLAEPAIQSMPELVEKLLPQVVKLADRPLVLFGHSMGALVAFELAHALHKAGHPLPMRLIVSAYRSPERVRQTRDLHALPHEAFIDALRVYGGTPEAVLAHEETMELLTPMLRADFKLHETHSFDRHRTVQCPITALAGQSDHIVPASELNGWNQYTTSSDYALHTYPGGHFFIHSAREAVLARINADIERDLVAA